MAFQKRSQQTDFIDPLASKKPRISHFTQRAQPILNGRLGAPNGHETLLPAPVPTPSDTLSSSHLPPRLEPPRTHDPLADVSNDLGHSTQDYKHQEATPAPASRLGLPLLTDFPQAEQPASSSHVHSRPKKKSKKHKDKERPPEERPPAPQPDSSTAPALPTDAPGQCHLVFSSGMWGMRPPLGSGLGAIVAGHQPTQCLGLGAEGPRQRKHGKQRFLSVLRCPEPERPRESREKLHAGIYPGQGTLSPGSKGCWDWQTL